MLCIAYSTITLATQEASTQHYPPSPSFSQLAGNIWDDLGQFTTEINPVDNALPLLGLTATTLLLVAHDEAITQHVQRLAHKWGILSDTQHGREARIVFDPSVGGFDIPFRIPQNLVSSLYFMGDAPMHIAIYSGLATYGAIYDNNRARNAASQVAEGVLATGILIQIMKRCFGRESPFQRTEAGGAWDLFPNQIDYAYNVAKYDAMPAGHMATAMATTHILAGNYPEYKYIKPVGYTLTSMIGLAMIINGVHWAGDYPLGLATGYLVANIVLKRGKEYRERFDSTHSLRHSRKIRAQFLPYIHSSNNMGLWLSVSM